MPVSAPVGTTISLTATGVGAAAVTLTIPAPAAGTFHYISYIEISKVATALLTAAATPVLVTTTNLNGNPTIDFSAGAELAGSAVVRQISPSIPLKSAVAATATTIVCPATTAVIWRVSAFWFVGP